MRNRWSLSTLQLGASMKARRKQKRVFQHQPRTEIPPKTIPDEIYNDYKYEYNDISYTHENLSTTPRGDLRSQYI